MPMMTRDQAYNPRSVARILSVSYDPALLCTRELLLQSRGYEVVSAEGFAEAIELCEGHFDLIVMGHSIPQKDKRAIISELRKQSCTAPVVSLLRGGESRIPEATHGVDPGNPREMLEAIEDILRTRKK